MKIAFFSLILLLISLTSFGQPFTFSDAEFSTNQFIVLYDINFEFAEVKLQENQLQLDSLVGFLIRNDTLGVEIGVHTGFRGNDKYNLKISKDRVELMCAYLLKRGVKAENINCIGFGENKPVFEYEDWEKIAETHRCGFYERGNRRVTVVIKELVHQ